MSIPYFDCHCDTIIKCITEDKSLRSSDLHLDLLRLKRYSPSAQVFSICTETSDEPAAKAEYALKVLKSQLLKNSDIAKLCLNFNDIVEAESESKIAAFISIEGAEQISDLQRAYDEGVRIVHLTWNFDNELSGAAVGSGDGLTEKGKAFVRAAQRLGMLLDMSHISEAGFWDVVAITTRPVIAGHSNSSVLCDNKRNLSDEQFAALKNCGGGAGVNLYPNFLGKNAHVDTVISHIEHFLSLGGEKSIFLGCDFDGIDITPERINGVQDMPLLYETLLKYNYKESLVNDIFYYNIRRIMEKVL